MRFVWMRCWVQGLQAGECLPCLGCCSALPVPPLLPQLVSINKHVLRRREDDTARLATARADAEQRAAAAEGEAAALRQQLEAAQQQLAAERKRGEELVGWMYPLTARVKALEAAQAAGSGADREGERGSGAGQAAAAAIVTS